MTLRSTLRRQNALLHRLLGAAAFALALSLAAPAAHAQWAVNDANANATLKQIETHTNDTVTQTTDINSVLGKTLGDGSTVNGNINAINEKLKIGTYDEKQPGARVKDPTQTLPEDTTKLDDGTRCKAVAQPQQATCQQIVDIENAQYQYMLTMYKNTATRDAMLRELLKERAAIQASDANQFGKLEDNTNKLTALYNLIALDQQQMQTVNYAYEANLRFLRAKQTIAANAASTGKQPSDWGSISLPGIGDVNIGSAISGLATGAALKASLDGVQSAKPSGMQTLSIGDSNGF
ncbi:hypothetical protein [Luteibacter sp. UNCMF366Tsu5.1]|uniref:hypothetical protein n=1 Tax=Luteibacter sp. UNCMF366Tsu5.1 TaxID=1502758 RepID=UPI0009088B34|nr:hypothetical protein [Luteibacter sp. UNCMF366Tsu5.1]SFW62916.1 hypothetical protein SAMN02800691_2684 [Luteibacter sp. UNCMF366Tsu5.1]